MDALYLSIYPVMYPLAMKSKVEPDVTRYPTDKWAGDYFSYSMPPVPRENPSVSIYIYIYPIINNNYLISCQQQLLLKA